MKNIFTATVRRSYSEQLENRWKVAFTILLLFVFSALINVPYSREVRRLMIRSGEQGIKLIDSILGDLATAAISGFVVGVVLIFVGLWLSAKTNLGTPVLARLFSRESVKSVLTKDVIISSIVLAVVVAIVLLGLFEIQKEFYPIEHKMSRPSKAYYILVSFSAGISEEIMFRLGLMSFIVILLQSIKRVDRPTDKMVWLGIFISSVFFGLMHLPLSKNFVELAPFSIGVTMVGNFITGTTFGWIFWKRGLLIAIVSHIIFDLVFHVIGTPFG